jgi:outer membrane protein TolC
MATWCFLLLNGNHAFAQNAPASADRPWQAPAVKQIEAEADQLRAAQSRDSRLNIDPNKVHSLAELVDLAESHNPATRVTWERARAQAASLGVARSELYPTLAAVVSTQVGRSEILFGNQFIYQTIGGFQLAMALSYNVFDFGARAGRINAASAEVLAANFGFNDAHRNVIYQVEQAYYRLLNATGQEDAARASLANARTVQQSAEDRLTNGLATLPDVLEARSATAQAEYDLQSVLGAEEIARGDLATAVGTSAKVKIQVQPLDQLSIPDTADDTVDQAIDRALEKRPDLLQQVAQIRSANARVKEARAAYYPALSAAVSPAGQSLFGLQGPLAWTHTRGLTGEAAFNLQWTVFDGGARRKRLEEAKADVQTAQAQAKVLNNQIADEVWTSYSNLNTAFRQRQAAVALLQAATQSYNAALASYNYGVRSLLDVTAAQRTLAQARASDVLARTQVLAGLADVAFRTADSIQLNAAGPQP